jgi:hypothetical protein
MNTIHHWLVAALFASGCIVGDVRDATDNAVMKDVSVLAIGTCSGHGCASATAATTSSNGVGFYRFDPYDRNEPTTMTPGDGKDAMELIFFESGFYTMSAFHTAVYQVDKRTGEPYSLVGPTWMTPSNLWSDSDGDGLSDLEEGHLGTSPSNPDTDGDGLSDLVETRGVGWVNLGDLGADPLRKDVFVECDYMPGFEPTRAAIDLVVASYADAPVHNVDGRTGITLHVDIDDEVADADADYNLDPVLDELARIKSAYFNADRAPYYRYCLWTQQISSGYDSGLGLVSGDDFIVSLGGAQGNVTEEAGTFMHELGHTMGLLHGGVDGINHKPNYLSVMNYSFQFTGLRRDGDRGVVDYSRSLLATLDETALFETQGLDPTESTTEAEIARYETRNYAGVLPVWTRGGAHENINWNRSFLGSIQFESVSADINGELPSNQVLVGHDDWEAISFITTSIGRAVPGDSVSQTVAVSSSSAKADPQHGHQSGVRESLSAQVRSRRQTRGAVQMCQERHPSTHMPELRSAQEARRWRAAHNPDAIREQRDSDVGGPQ